MQRTLEEVALEDPDTGLHLGLLRRQLLVTNESNEHLIEGLVALADSNRGLIGSAPVRLDQVLTAVVTSYQLAAVAQEISMTMAAEPCQVDGDAVFLERLVTNLV